MTIILLLFLSASLSAQFYEYGQDAGRLKWYQFHTPNYQVVFPEGIDSLAKVFAHRLESLYPHQAKQLDHNHSRMPVIIHNESSFSNGVFVWAPKRLEIFTNPDPNGYPQDWLNQLALHEGRHAVQIDKLNQGFSRGLYFIGGEQLVGAMAIFLPYWYLEGDAVDAETRLSRTGRGRQPSFEMELKAQMLGKGQLFSFSKAILGSYRHYIPNHYMLGYLMVRHGRSNYGDQLWIDFQQYAGRRPFLLNPTYFSMRKHGISSKPAFYREALDRYRKHWEEMASKRSYTTFDPWNIREKPHYTSYAFPHLVSDSLAIALKSGIDQIPEFILIGKGGNERGIIHPGYMSSGKFSYAGNRVVWDEFVPDTRWSNRNYSNIRMYEIGSGEITNLTRKARYYAPSLSGRGDRIAVVEQTKMQEFNLVLLDLNGETEISAHSDRFIQHPAWMAQDSALVLVRSDGSGKALVRFDLVTGHWQTLFESGFDDISHPVVRGDRVYFSSTFSGIDNIYCLDLSENKTYQVTSARFGAFYPHVSAGGERLLYADYTADGFDLVEAPLEKSSWKPLEEVAGHEEQLDHAPSREEVKIHERLDLQDTATYDIQPYQKHLNLFNLHSWLPLYVDYLDPQLTLNPEHLPVSPGISLISQNQLSTAVSQVGYEYRDGYHKFHSGIRLKGRYPVVEMLFDAGGPSDVLLYKDAVDTAMALPTDLTFRAQSYVPLRLNTGSFLSLVQPMVSYRYSRDLQYIEETDRYRKGVHYLYYHLYATSYLRKGPRDILPRLGITTTSGYYHALFDNRLYKGVFIGGITGYVPGLLPHHSIRLSYQYQKQYPLDEQRPSFINLISAPRGHYGIFGEVFNKFSADYVFPILYPDLEAGPVLYLKRVRGALWVDHMAGRNVRFDQPSPHLEDHNYTTFGIDLTLDMNLLRIPFPLSVGGRFIFEPSLQWIGYEWLFAVDID